MKKAIAGLFLSLAIVGCDASNANRGGGPREEAVTNAPLTADTRYAAAQLAEAKGAYPQAIEQYKEALKSDPKHLHSMYALGCLQVQTRDYMGAIATWNKYVKATKGSAQAYCDLAYAEEWAGKTAAARADYERAIKADPKDENTRVNYGMMLARAGEMDAAAKQLGVVLTEAEVHYDLASMYAARGNKMQAKAEYQKALDIDPDMTDAKVKLASLN
jgi:tetratricopeptide (TPR) repeat protein